VPNSTQKYGSFGGTVAKLDGQQRRNLNQTFPFRPLSRESLDLLAVFALEFGLKFTQSFLADDKDDELSRPPKHKTLK